MLSLLDLIIGGKCIFPYSEQGYLESEGEN